MVPFQLTANVKDDRNNTDLGSATLYIEAYLRNDNIKSTWILEMTNIKLTNLNGNLFTADKQLGQSIYKYEQFTNSNFNKLFLKDNEIKIQYDDDLIPDKVDLTYTDNSSVGSTESSYDN